MASKTQITSEGAKLLATSTQPNGVHWWIGWYALAYVPPEMKANEGEKLTSGMKLLTKNGDIIYNIFQGDNTGEGYVSTTGPNDQFGIVNYDSNIKKNYRYVIDSEGRNNLVAYVDDGNYLKGAHVYRGVNVKLPIGSNTPTIDDSEIPLPAPLLYIGTDAGDKGYSGNGAQTFVSDSKDYYQTIDVNFDDTTGEVAVPRVSTDFRHYDEYKRGVDAGADDSGNYIGNLPIKFNGTDTPIDADGWAKSEATYQQGGHNDLRQDYNQYCKEYWKALSISNFNKYCAPVNSAGLAYDEDCGCRNMSKATKYFPIYRYDVLNTEKKEVNEYVTGIKLGIKLNLVSKNIGDEPYYKPVEPSADGTGVASLNNEFKDIEDRSGNQIFAANSISFKFNRIGIYAVPMRQYGCTGDNVKKAQYQIDTEMEPVLFAVCDWDEAHILSDSGDGLTTFESNICIDLATAVDDSAVLRESALYYNMYEDDSIEWYKNQLLANASMSEAMMNMQMDVGYMMQKMQGANNECCNQDDREWAEKNHTHNYLKNLVDAEDVESNSVRNIEAVEEDETIPAVYNVNADVDPIGINFGSDTKIVYGGDTNYSSSIENGEHLGIYYGSYLIGSGIKPLYLDTDDNKQYYGTVNDYSSSQVVKAKVREHVVWIGKYGFLDSPLYAPCADVCQMCYDAYSVVGNNCICSNIIGYSNVSTTNEYTELQLPVTSSTKWDSVLGYIPGTNLNSYDKMALYMNASKIVITETYYPESTATNKYTYKLVAYNSSGEKMCVDRLAPTNPVEYYTVNIGSYSSYSFTVDDASTVDYVTRTYDVTVQSGERRAVEHKEVHRKRTLEFGGCAYYRFDTALSTKLINTVFPKSSKWRIPSEAEWKYLIDNVTDEDIIKFRKSYTWTGLGEGTGNIAPAGYIYISDTTTSPTVYNDKTCSIFMISGTNTKVVKFDGTKFEIIDTSELAKALPGMVVQMVNILPICDGVPITSGSFKATLGKDSYALMKDSLTTGVHSFNASYRTKMLGDYCNALGSDGSVIGASCDHITLIGGNENAVYGVSSNVAIFNGYGNNVYQSYRTSLYGISNTLAYVEDSFIHGSYNAMMSIGAKLNVMLNGSQNGITLTNPAVYTNIFINGTRQSFVGSGAIAESSIINGRDSIVNNNTSISSSIVNFTSLNMNNAWICESVVALSNEYDKYAFGTFDAGEGGSLYRSIVANGGQNKASMAGTVFANQCGRIDAGAINSSLFATYASKLCAVDRYGEEYHNASVFGVIYAKAYGTIKMTESGINYSVLVGDFSAEPYALNTLAYFHCSDVYAHYSTFVFGNYGAAYSSIHCGGLTILSEAFFCFNDIRQYGGSIETHQFDYSMLYGLTNDVHTYNMKFSHIVGNSNVLHKSQRAASTTTFTSFQYSRMFGVSNIVEGTQFSFSSISGNYNSIGATIKNSDESIRFSYFDYNTLYGNDNKIDVESMKYGFIIGNNNTISNNDMTCEYITVHGTGTLIKSADLCNVHLYGNFKFESTTAKLSSMIILAAARYTDNVGSGFHSSYVAEFGKWIEDLSDKKYPMIVSESGIALYGNKMVLGDNIGSGNGKTPEVGDVLTVVHVEGNVATVAWRHYSDLKVDPLVSNSIVFYNHYHGYIGPTPIPESYYETKIESNVGMTASMICGSPGNGPVTSVSCNDGYIALFDNGGTIRGYNVGLEIRYKNDVAINITKSEGKLVKGTYLHSNINAPVESDVISHLKMDDTDKDNKRYLIKFEQFVYTSVTSPISFSGHEFYLNEDHTTTMPGFIWRWKKDDNFETTKECIIIINGSISFESGKHTLELFAWAGLFDEEKNVKLQWTVIPY